MKAILSVVVMAGLIVAGVLVLVEYTIPKTEEFNRHMASRSMTEAINAGVMPVEK